MDAAREEGTLVVRVAIVEDDPAYREEMVGFLQQFSQESGQKFHITTFSDGKEITENYAAAWDMILMDIEMPGLDGMTAAERIRKLDGDVVIIFITNMPQYAMKGYTVDALDYVLKPVSYYAFTQRISRALERMKRRTRRFVSIPLRTGIAKVELSQLTYVEIVNHDLIYHTQEGDFTCKGSLTEAAEKLEKEHFFRISNCYLVNLEYVECIQNGTVTVNGQVLTVSRSRKKLLLDEMNNYINEVSK